MISTHAAADLKQVVSFSGGRSSLSAALVKLEARERLDSIAFANTGLESESTYLFIEAADRYLQRRYGVAVVCLELRPKGKPKYEVVPIADCDREGKTFKAAVQHKKYLPNRRFRTCTQEMKVMVLERYYTDLYGADNYVVNIGFRKGEDNRVAASKARAEKPPVRLVAFPLYTQGIDQQMVFWKMERLRREPEFAALPFDIASEKTRLSNCVGCFQKPVRERVADARDFPEQFARMQEIEEGARSFLSGSFDYRNVAAKEATALLFYRKFTWDKEYPPHFKNPTGIMTMDDKFPLSVIKLIADEDNLRDQQELDLFDCSEHCGLD